MLLAGVTGEELIVDKFRAVYEELYNSWDTSEAMVKIKEQVHDEIKNDSISEAEKL